MSEEALTGRGRTLTIAAWVVLPVVVLGVLLALTLRNTAIGPDDSGKPKTVKAENHLATVRSTLAKQNDLATCKAVIPQLNAHLQSDPDSLPRPLPGKTKEDLGKDLTLDEGGLAELTSATFTPLDAYHLETCFLVRDAARSLELVVATGKTKQTPLERAELAFSWVVRQVRLQPSAPPGQGAAQEPAPPAFVLRRGWGSALERALVFLAVLEQFGLDDDASAGLQGALLFCPGSARGEEKRRLWACGVTIGERPDALYLFDPRLGLPLPGPGGNGIATLAAVRSDPSVLAQLQIDKVRYDVTPEQAKAAEVFLVCPLSALAPRMALLQDRMLRERTWKDQTLPSQVRVRLAEDLAATQSSLQSAVQKSGSTAKVSLWPEGATLLRRFVPKEDGGADVSKPFPLRLLRGITTETDPAVVLMNRQLLAQMEVVPWKHYPPLLRDPRFFGQDQGLGRALRQRFMSPFLQAMLEPGGPRDLILRGQLTKAAPDLVREQEHWLQANLRLRNAEQEKAELTAGVAAWVETAFARYAALQTAPTDPTVKAAVGELWKWRPGDAIAIQMDGSISRGRGAEVTYQLGLCKHELAARLQARKDLAGRGSSAAADSKTAIAWKDAEGYWKEYADSIDSDRPGLVSSWRLRGEALAMRGQTKEAIAVWQTNSDSMTDLDRLAHLWLARRK